MTAAHKRQQECQRKFSFKSYSHASRAMNELLDRQYRGGEMEVYSCGWCDGHHIGHKVGQHNYTRIYRQMGLKR